MGFCFSLAYPTSTTCTESASLETRFPTPAAWPSSPSGSSWAWWWRSSRRPRSSPSSSSWGRRFGIPFTLLAAAIIVNTIGSEEIGGYYLAIQILWSFMLVPALAFADSAKALVANASDDMARVRLLLWSALTITALIMLVWVALTPVFPAAASALNSDPETVRWTVTSSGMLFVPYVLFSFNAVMDSFFYGLGRTKYLAFQSAITNGTVYVVAFILCITGAWDPTFEGGDVPLRPRHRDRHRADGDLPGEGAVPRRAGSPTRGCGCTGRPKGEESKLTEKVCCISLRHGLLAAKLSVNTRWLWSVGRRTCASVLGTSPLHQGASRHAPSYRNPEPMLRGTPRQVRAAVRP